MLVRQRRRMRIAPFKLFVLLLAIAGLAACGQQQTLLTVHASAETRAAPDLAIVTLGVVAQGPSAQAAQRAQSARMQAVLAAASAAHVAEEDVQTVGFSLEPQYAYARGTAPRITGYLSRNTVSIRVKDLAAVSALIDATVAEGANELQGVQFAFSDEEASRDAARAKALDTARQRAEAYAKAADMRVARILAITEPGAAARPEAYRARYGGAVMAEAAPQNAVRPGQLDAESDVTVIFELR